MRDEEAFIGEIAGRLGQLPNVMAVALGGSRAVGTQHAGSDYDFAVYYRAHFDPYDLRAMGWEGTVSEIGGWGGGIMNGGAWLRIDGSQVDVHYRDLDEVEHHIAEAQAGRFAVQRLPFYLAGIPTYIVVGELAVGRTLSGELPRPEYPTALRREATLWWHDASELSLSYAESAYARAGDALGVAGALARAVVEEAHARLAGRGEWALNEKRIVAQAGLDAARCAFAQLGTTPGELVESVAMVKAALLCPAGA